MTGLSPAELLMGRKLRDKLPKLRVSNDRATEAQWQQLLRDRDAQAKLRQKEYADSRTSASHSNIEEGDQVLLRQARQNKLSPTYEPEPYRVIQRNGSAVIIENADGESKMRNVGCMKKGGDVVYYGMCCIMGLRDTCKSGERDCEGSIKSC